MSQNNDFNFQEVESPKESKFLRPGFYILRITGAEFVEPEGTKQDGSAKTPYLKVGFETKDGAAMSESFFITPKAISRLQYLHEAWIGKRLDKAFGSPKEVSAYFDKLFSNEKAKQIWKGVCVGGKQATNGKIYTQLSYSGFVLPEDMNFEEGAFKEGDYNWNQNVEMSKESVTHSNDTMIPESSSVATDEDDHSDLPF